MGILPEAVAAFVTAAAAALIGWLYQRLLGTRRLKQRVSESPILHNLPARPYSLFIGRREELTKLQEFLSPDDPTHLICVTGIGGVGKTALVLEVAFQCFRADSFDAIIFVSAKRSVLTSDGDLTRYATSDTLNEIILAFAHTLDRRDILSAEPEERPTILSAALTGLRTLLIVDNLETADDKDEVITFLQDLPPQVKVIVASRERLPFPSILLEPLSERESLAFISQEAQQREISVSDEQARVLHQVSGGIPLAMKFAVGQAAFLPIDSVMKRMQTAASDLLRFTLDSAVAAIRGQPAYLLLMALAILPEEVALDTLAHTAGLTDAPSSVEDGSAQLLQLNLVYRRENKYGLHHLTRQYALGELSASPEFEREVRGRIGVQEE